MLIRIRDHIIQLRRNYETMRQAASDLAQELEQRPLAEVQSLLDNPAAAFQIERTIDGAPLRFTIQEWGNEEGTERPGFSVNVTGLKTLLGIKPGHHFYKGLD